MTTNEIISILVMVAVVVIVLWDIHRNKENEPGE